MTRRCPVRRLRPAYGWRDLVTWPLFRLRRRVRLRRQRPPYTGVLNPESAAWFDREDETGT